MLALEDNHSSRRRPLRVAVALLSALAVAGVSALALRHGASPKPVVLVPRATTAVTCGQTIIVSIVVGNDLTCPPGTDGLNVGHASITINLNGHTFAGGGNGYSGIANPGFSTVTIENGRVSGWSSGVNADGPLGKVTGIRATANTFGIYLFGTGSSATSNVVWSNSNYGIYFGAPNGKLTSNVARENTFTGIAVTGSGDLVQTNQSENNGFVGIVDGGVGNTLTGNVSNANGAGGIDTTGDQTATLTSNTANYNTGYGIAGSPGGKDGGGNAAKGNTQATQCKDVVCA